MCACVWVCVRRARVRTYVRGASCVHVCVPAAVSVSATALLVVVEVVVVVAVV